LKKKYNILLVGPINNSGSGGRIEEMKVWANSLESENIDISVYSMFNSKFKVGNAKMIESANIEFGFIYKFFPTLFPLIIRIWSSKFFKLKRKNFYFSKSWLSFASSFDRIVLFINDTSEERLIFESELTIPVAIRFTGILHNLNRLENDSKKLFQSSRYYIFHDKSLLKGYNPGLETKFIDQTVLNENSLVNLPITPNLKKFGMVGLFMAVKQISSVILIFKSFPELDLFLYGEGELKSEYDNLISEHKISNVFFKGYFSPDTINQVYSEFDCLIINSSNETGPMIGVEAMAAGKLVLSRPVGAMESRLTNPELIFHSEQELIETLQKIQSWNENKVIIEKTSLREQYLNQYSNESLKLQILNCLEVN
jgi:glycosyltransferase involved in cell wall biosynthesis